MEIEKIVNEKIAQVLGVEEDGIAQEHNLVKDYGADSLDLIEIVMEIEKELNMSIPDSQADKFKTVGDFVEYLKESI